MKKRWGWHIVLLKGNEFKIKLLCFKKDGEISLQRHKKREEVWLFLKGFGRFNLGGITQYVGKGMSKVVPKNTWHHYKALKNTYVLEIQTGKCEEGDIERHA